MEHQDWNNVAFNNKSDTKKREDSKKINSSKLSNPEDVKIEAPKELGKLISQARTTKGKNQKELASELGVNQQILGRWESNKEIPTNLQIANIEKKLGIKLPRTKKIKVAANPA
jgi:ribosome-binding protein aMBF1 (putative translation factor)